MALGWCMKCETLRTIVKLALKLGSRECEWGPIEHDVPDTHRTCGGAIVESDSASGGTPRYWCERCESFVGQFSRVIGVGRCLGSRKPIR